MKIELGCTYADKVTGFYGVAIGHVDYMTGCNQTLLSPRVGEDGKKIDSHWFDDVRLELSVHVERVKLYVDEEHPGCAEPAPTK